MRMLCVSLIVVATAAPAFGQTCGGLPSFNGAPGQISGGLKVWKDGGGFLSSIQGGSDALFLGGGYLATRFNAVDATQHTLFAGIGSEWPLEPSHHVFFCPGAEIGWNIGPDTATVTQRGTLLLGSGYLGFIAAESGSFSVVPNVGLSYEYVRTTATHNQVSTTGTQTLGIAQIGIGFIFGRRTALLPLIYVPFGIEGSETQFVIMLAHNFGG